MIYFISTLLLTLMLIAKIFFLFIEKGCSTQYLSIFSVIFIISVLIIGSYNYIKTFSRQKKGVGRGQKINIFGVLLLILVLIVLGLSFFINYHTKVLVWDSVALYDARAKFLLQNVNFSQMVNLSKYDPKNSYYYLLYPPYTSIIHYFWYKVSIPVSVNIFYSINLLMLGVGVYLSTYKKIGKPSAILLTLLSVGNDIIFSGSLSGYTNLPFTLHIIMGVFLLAQYVEDNKLWKLLFGLALVMCSQWIRFLEPVWLGIAASLLIVKSKDLKKDKNKFLFILVFTILYGLIEYFSWGNFVSSFGDQTKIVNFSSINIIEPFVGVFTGSLFSILLQFIKYWGLMLLVYILSILNFHKKINSVGENNLDNQKLLLRLIILFSIIIYFGGLYFVSFQTDWWNKLGDSLIRSSSFLIPICGYLLLVNLLEKK